MLLDWFNSTQMGAAVFYNARAAGVKRPRKPKPYPLPEALRPKQDLEKKTLGSGPRPVDEIDAWLLKKNGR